MDQINIDDERAVSLLKRWIAVHPDHRCVMRIGDRLVLIDREEELKAETGSSYEDSVRKVGQIGIDRDYAESKGVKL